MNKRRGFRRGSGCSIWRSSWHCRPGLLILGAGVALVVICGSRGPVFFRQRRVGYKGREFTCYKFRTMQVDAETDSHRDHFRQLMEREVPMTKLDARSDPRLVPLGALLRATGLDELPQLINVAARRDEPRGAAALHPLRIRALPAVAAAAV